MSGFEDFDERIEDGDHDKLVDTLLNMGEEAFELPHVSPRKKVLIAVLQYFGHGISKDQALDLCVVLDEKHGGPEKALKAIKTGALEQYSEDSVSLPKGYQLKS